MAELRPTKCSLYAYHRPRPFLIEYHHVQPRAMGGADVPANKVALCTNCHYAVHGMLTLMLKAQPLPPHGWDREIKVAKQGYDAWVAAGKPGKPVYEA